MYRTQLAKMPTADRQHLAAVAVRIANGLDTIPRGWCSTFPAL
jgi:hypothetical protein